MRFPRRAHRRGQENAESLMIDTVIVRRNTGVTEPDPGNPYEPKPVYFTVYVGVGKIQSYEGQYEQSKESGGGAYTEARLWFHSPLGAGPYLPGDEVVVTGVDNTDGNGDQSRIGERFEIASDTGKSIATAQRLPVTRLEAIR